MKKLSLFLLFSSTGFSLLPPLAQSAKEIQALLADPRFYESLGSAETVQQIVRNEMGYLIVTQHYTMQVNLHFIRSERKICGPAHFELEFLLPVRS